MNNQIYKNINLICDIDDHHIKGDLYAYSLSEDGTQLVEHTGLGRFFRWLGSGIGFINKQYMKDLSRLIPQLNDSFRILTVNSFKVPPEKLNAQLNASAALTTMNSFFEALPQSKINQVHRVMRELFAEPECFLKGKTAVVKFLDQKITIEKFLADQTLITCFPSNLPSQLAEFLEQTQIPITVLAQDKNDYIKTFVDTSSLKKMAALSFHLTEYTRFGKYGSNKTDIKKLCDRINEYNSIDYFKRFKSAQANF